MKDEMADEQTAEKPRSKYTNRGGNGGPPGNKNHLKHGYYSGPAGSQTSARWISGRYSGMVLENAGLLEADLGGDLSTAERMLVADVALDTLLLQALNNEVADSPSLGSHDSLQGLAFRNR